MVMTKMNWSDSNVIHFGRKLFWSHGRTRHKRMPKKSYAQNVIGERDSAQTLLLEPSSFFAHFSFTRMLELMIEKHIGL